MVDDSAVRRDGPITEILRRYWGYSSLRPLQNEAIEAALEGRDALIVMPTGGGKSLCYQIPPLVRSDLTVVVSPLISLMKDQVDSLRANGISARQVDSTVTDDGKRTVASEARSGSLRLLFVAPERLVMPRFREFLQSVGVARFAIDEAHCISHWGHDFRPSYRALADLREHFPEASIHALTATATRRVREDIVRQLELRDAATLIGSFDRPNLTYRVLVREEPLRQILGILEKHPGEGGIVYCIRRKDVDDLSSRLVKNGVNAIAYHAGMSQEDREAAQNSFSTESCDVIVATVAFGMGIDRSNVRFVVHAAMPKSVEHYQQETGRAGRDGMDAECALLYSGADHFVWRSILERSAKENGADEEIVRSSIRQLDEMSRYARGSVCRHRALVEYFDQRLETADCRACDLCLGETRFMPDSAGIASTILSCVSQTGQRFGAGYLAAVLRGARDERVRANGHDRLESSGVLKMHSLPDVRDWIWQVAGHGLLTVTGSEYPILRLAGPRAEIVRATRDVRLVAPQPKRNKGRATKSREKKGRTMAGLGQRETELFEILRGLRRRLASERRVPAYVIFGDATLRELAISKPASLTALSEIYGVGEAKLKDPGPAFLEVIREFVASQRA